MWACRFSAGFCSGEPCRDGVACWGGWGPHTPCARQIGPHPPQPTPPSRHGSLRYVLVRRRRMRGVFFSVLVSAYGDSPLEAGGRATTSARSRRSSATRFRRQRVKKPFKTQAHTGPHGQGVSRPTISARSVRRTALPLNGRRAKQHRPDNAARAKQHHPNPNNQTDSQPEVMPETSPPPWSTGDWLYRSTLRPIGI